MSLIPAFEIGVWNAWILIVPCLLVNFGLSFLFVGRKSALWVSPSYTRLERICVVIGEFLMGGLWILQHFLTINCWHGLVLRWTPCLSPGFGFYHHRDADFYRYPCG